MSITAILNEIKKYTTKNITVTGGEPLIHEDIKYLLRALSEEGYDVNVETNGSVSIDPYFEDNECLKREYLNVWFTIDYKSLSSGMKDKMDSNNFKYPYRKTVYKFVVGNKDDLDEAKLIINRLITNTEGYNLSNLIYISPVFGEIEPKEIVEYMQKNNLFSTIIPIRVQVQLHKIIGDKDKRGV